MIEQLQDIPVVMWLGLTALISVAFLLGSQVGRFHDRSRGTYRNNSEKRRLVAAVRGEVRSVRTELQAFCSMCDGYEGRAEASRPISEDAARLMLSRVMAIETPVFDRSVDRIRGACPRLARDTATFFDRLQTLRQEAGSVEVHGNARATERLVRWCERESELLVRLAGSVYALLGEISDEASAASRRR